MRRNLKPTDLGDLLELPILAILATRSSTNEVLLSPVWHEWDNSMFTVVTWANDIKSRQIAATPGVSIVVAEQQRPYRSIEVRGHAVLSKPSDLNAIVTRIATRYLGEEMGQSYAAEYGSVELEKIEIRPDTIRAWDFADEVG